MATSSASAIPRYRCDLGDSVSLSVTTTSPTTGQPITPVALTCTVTRPDGTVDVVTLTASDVGVYAGAYHTEGSTKGVHLGVVTATYAGSFRTLDYFRIVARDPS